MHSCLFPVFLLVYFSLNAANGFLLTPERSVAEDVARGLHKPYKRRPDDPKKPSNPIVFIPGDGGSRLQANLTGRSETPHYACYKTTADFYDLWLNLEQFVPVTIDCWADNMRLLFNNRTNLSENNEGVDIRVPGFGNTDTVEWLDASKRSPGLYFASIADALASWGYTRGKNIVGAPYDWRRAPHELNDYYLMLQTLIEMLHRYNGNQKVVILAHSMGNPVMNFFYHRYVDQLWKDKYIQAHISLAGAWGGSMQIVKLFASGYNMDYYRVILPPSSLRPMQRSFTSSAFLFPSSRLWTDDELLAITDNKNYTLSNIVEFFQDIDYTIGITQYGLTKDTLMLDPPGVQVHCMYGTEVQTPEQFVWSKGYFPDYQPNIIYGTGDGTVNKRSLETCTQWNSSNNAGKLVETYEINGADHMAILKDKRTIDYIREILYGKISK
ncbi:lecithin:cholesterol acyltransferase domain-containing protein [Ditylenchus destructor]|nr:lecithin:cholesterol acyltransferase domain-containing protein [Ditylenchus destructor]